MRRLWNRYFSELDDVSREGPESSNSLRGLDTRRASQNLIANQETFPLCYISLFHNRQRAHS